MDDSPKDGGFPKRETERLVLRAIRADDWQSVHRYMSDPLVIKWLPEGTLDEKQSREFATKNTSENFQAVAVLTRDSNEFIGHMVFHPWFVPQTYEIGWVFSREHQRRGYASEAARSLLAYAFESMHSHRVIATCQPENVASWRVMEKLEMRQEAFFRKCIRRPSGEWWDEYFYAILAEEYFRRAADTDRR
jgi:[ribosomal protein S5]-alanine N-acetyltransferase